MSWSEMLALDMKHEYRVRNWSMNGNSNNMILAQTERILRDFQDEDHIMIIQFTRPMRQTFAKTLKLSAITLIKITQFEVDTVIYGITITNKYPMLIVMIGIGTNWGSLLQYLRYWTNHIIS